MSDSRLKTVMVSGIGRRLGLRTCEYFLQQGYTVAGITRTSNQQIEQLKKEYPHHFDVCECATYDHAGVSAVLSQFSNSRIDVLINNASYFVEDAVEEDEKVAQYQAFFETHMLFPLLLSDWFASLSASQADSDRVIINLTDIYAQKPDPTRALYCSTKAALENLTLSLAAKFAPQIRVNSVQPGPLAFLPEHSANEKAKVLAQTLLDREGGFEVILSTFDYIIANSFLTGTSIKVDGGRSLVR